MLETSGARWSADQKQNEVSNPLQDLFLSNRVRVAGSVQAPLFCAQDVANKISDTGYRSALGRYPPEYKCTVRIKDTLGRGKDMLMLTEEGLYFYLMRSDLPAAKLFRKWALEQLVKVRHQMIDAAQLAAKIAADSERLAEYECDILLSRASAREEKLRNLLHRSASRDYHPSPDHSWPDYLEYCKVRYSATEEDGRVVDIPPEQTIQIEQLAQQYWDSRDYDEGYWRIHRVIHEVVAEPSEIDENDTVNNDE